LKYRSVALIFPDDTLGMIESKFSKNSIFGSSKELYARYTRSLLVGENYNKMSEIIPFFFSCKNLEGLGWWLYSGSRKKLREFLASTRHPRLRRLSIFTGALPLRDRHLFSAPIFKNLTHLDLIYTPPPSAQDFNRRIPWDDLRTLDYLIYLHLDFLVYDYPQPVDPALEVVDELLASCPPRLRYIALLFHFAFLIEALISPDSTHSHAYGNLIQGVVDKRIVVGTDRGKFVYLRDEEGVHFAQTSRPEDATDQSIGAVDEREEREEEEQGEQGEDDDEGDDEEDEEDEDEEDEWDGWEEDEWDEWDEYEEEDEWEEELTLDQTNKLNAFGKWMIPSARYGRRYRIREPRGETKPDFWEEVEETVERRNVELYPSG
jgi:hypothetical protein